ncbi:MAG: AtpZ/AtpI family protein [Chloroflexi bacterium]|nr:AtpZ/AtpI family protein [Chloroflexota bacterium]
MSKWQMALRLTGIGFFIGGSIVGGVLGGLWLDSQLNTRLFWLLGLVLGLGMAGWGVYRMLLPLVGNNK